MHVHYTQLLRTRLRLTLKPASGRARDLELNQDPAWNRRGAHPSNAQTPANPLTHHQGQPTPQRKTQQESGPQPVYDASRQVTIPLPPAARSSASLPLPSSVLFSQRPSAAFWACLAAFLTPTSSVNSPRYLVLTVPGSWVSLSTAGHFRIAARFSSSNVASRPCTSSHREKNVTACPYLRRVFGERPSARRWRRNERCKSCSCTITAA
jgi:hypothetical protein